jgi:hypothetical protein
MCDFFTTFKVPDQNKTSVEMAALCLREARRKARRRKLHLLAGALWFFYVRRSERRTRSVWARPWLLRRDELGAYDTLLTELRAEDQGSFLNFLRLTPGLFDELVMKVTPYIKRSDTTFRKAISPGMRLAITLRYLATGKIKILQRSPNIMNWKCMSKIGNNFCKWGKYTVFATLIVGAFG